MTGKQKALRALGILAAVIALCMFFGRTVQTITTAKVQRISATKGKLEEKISLTAQVYFPKTEQVLLREAKKLGVTVEKISVSVGNQVKKGDTILTAYAPEYETKLAELQKERDKKVRELAQERAGHIRFLSTTKQNDLYNRMMDAYDAYYDARYEAAREALLAGYALPEHQDDWAAAAPDAPESVRAAMEKTLTCQTEMQAAVAALKTLYNTGEGRVGDETFSHVKKMDELRDAIAEYDRQMLELEARRAALETIVAPHDGYITEISVKVGDSIDGSKPTYAISEENAEPCLRVDITDVKKALSEGSKATLESGAATKIEKITVAPDGKKYAQLTLSKDVLKTGGGLGRLMGESSLPVTVVYKAAKNTTLLPASAVRQEGEGAYVYVVSRDYGGGLLGSGGYKLSKQSVTVLEKSDKLVSLADDLSYVEIADREDRALRDGQAVMDYVD